MVRSVLDGGSAHMPDVLWHDFADLRLLAPLDETGVHLVGATVREEALDLVCALSELG